MVNRLLPILAIVVCAPLVAGCFVVEELDKGMELMEAHGGQHGHRKAEAEEPASVEVPSS